MNKWMGTGNLVRDPELSYTQSNMAKCVMTIACNRPKKNNEDQGADYIRIVTWGKRAETCDRYLFKGRKVAVSGSIRTGSYKDKDGKTVYTTDVWADEVEFLSQHQSQQVDAAEVQKQADELLMPKKTTQMQIESQLAAGFDDMPDSFSSAEDDIPFR